VIGVTISEEIRKHNISRISLLKIDVERAELDVLNGIDEEDWSKIDHIAVEIENQTEFLEKVEKLLLLHGYECEKVPGGEWFCSIYAKRKPDEKQLEPKKT